MANWTISLPEALKKNLINQTYQLEVKRTHKELPEYPQFVTNLMKGLDTPALELHHATTGISGEAGELLDISKKVWIYGKPLNVEHLIEELGDLRFYYQSVLNMIGLTDADIVAANTTKLMKRYVDGQYTDKHANQRLDKPGEDRKFMADHTPVPTLTEQLQSLPVIGIINVDDPKDPRHKELLDSPE